MHHRWSRYHMSREIPQVSARGLSCRLRRPGKSDRDARSEVSVWIKRPVGVCCRGAEHLAPGNEPIRLLLTFIEPRGVGDLEAGNRPRDMQETAISMVETSVANQV